MVVFFFNKYLDIKIYKNSSTLYALSKLVKAINSDCDLPVIAWIGADNQTLEYKPVEFKVSVADDKRGFDTMMTFKTHADWIN